MNVQLWQEKIVEVLKDIADEEFQREAWFEQGDKVSSPEELYCNLLEDFVFEEFIEKQESLLSNIQLIWARELISKMRAFKGKIFSCSDPKEILDDERWREISQLADHLKATFKA
ncbi:hypothetical protein IQ265_00035 [Nodosilinea sp. LEGE 06152]|uniref:hypothetical protein n=1 Tax=Nodosilinea sp. LEGE 06152 TaxID=2777966 RepID=UPI00187DFFE9|nr:hypothetical protein [Nodosilinea sp. LEGE 06152]MBE9155237.1 hypothetical protein [Nodosilinea sp. LEGE 06152]